MPARSRWFYDEDEVQGSGNALALDETLKKNGELIQWSFTVGVLPVTDENFVLKKVSVLGPQYDLTIKDFNPKELGGLNYGCDNIWNFRKGDHVTADYPNTDDKAVAVELIFREASP
jgi:hypothetical protein